MEFLAVTLALLAAAAGFALGVALRIRRGHWLDELHRRQILVHTRDGQTLEGNLAETHYGGIVLEAATLADGPHKLAGQVWVPRERIAWVQNPPTAEV